jgi:putative beta-lysine N-acetyltransferase
MSISTTNNESLYLDRWEDIKTHDFNCHILISPYNKRITVYEFHLSRDSAAVEMVKTLDKKASENALDKIWLKSKAQYQTAFTIAGMRLEAYVPGYFRGKEPALIFARYLGKQRQIPSNATSKKLVDKLIGRVETPAIKRKLPHGIQIKWGERKHRVALANLYSQVFTTYPFPIFDPVFLESTMEQASTYYITAWHNQDLIAASSAEINRAQLNAEMTDFATLPNWRGNGLASFLLAEMENRLQKEGFHCLYTIARSSSTGMNSVFANAGYSYYGVLINNCNIGVGFEDMNVWAKSLPGCQGDGWGSSQAGPLRPAPR